MSQVSSQPGMGKSSLQPGVSGPSSGAPYGPKALEQSSIVELHSDTEAYRSGNNEKYREASPDDDCFDTFIDTGLTQNSLGESDLKP